MGVPVPHIPERRSVGDSHEEQNTKMSRRPPTFVEVEIGSFCDAGHLLLKQCTPPMI